MRLLRHNTNDNSIKNTNTNNSSNSNNNDTDDAFYRITLAITTKNVNIVSNEKSF